MTSSALLKNSFRRHRSAAPVRRRETDSEIALDQALQAVHTIVPPLWPLADYVAVNPCFGLADQSFLSACQQLKSVRDCDLLMPRQYFDALLSEGKITLDDVAAAWGQCASEAPEGGVALRLDDVTEWLRDTEHSAVENPGRFRTVAEAVDRHQGSSWSSHIINDITRHCGLHYDEGQAAWGSPWRSQTLYQAWREAAQLSRRMDLLGLREFRAFVASLPEDPKAAIRLLLRRLDVPEACWREMLLCEAFSVAGWSSYIRYRVREAELAGRDDDDLTGLIAMRLAYDAILARAPGIPWPLPLWPNDDPSAEELADEGTQRAETFGRYVLQVAAERAHRRELLRNLAAKEPAPRPSARKTAQLVFCIDVRSEVMRRHLEALDDSIETFGFAGFFGIPLEYVELGLQNGRPQCPVLLQPGLRVHERVRGLNPQQQDEILQKRSLIRRARRAWKLFQSSATSCFSFVESLGLTYLPKLFANSLRWSRPVNAGESDGLSGSLAVHVGPDIHCEKNQGLDATRRIDLAEGMLRNVGLTSGFARVIVVCGHACDVTNNPYRAALDCGACGGHSGEPNARVAAALLNDPDVRLGLASRGVVIPADSWFLAAVHNTTTDEVKICDAHLVPGSHLQDLERIEGWLEEAGQMGRLERGARLASTDPESVLQRSRDWAEVRPEWGLAGNSAFIVAPRSRTAGINLGGRAFMHSYDHRSDPELKVLELIMTAPMVVTNWINMQYYASAVDPTAFGSGNKVIHNVIGKFGVLEGNGGDLKTGLPWQSVHDGRHLQHEPLRLLVVIDAPRSSIQKIVEKHAVVRNLATNGWLTLVAWEGNEFHRWTSHGTWEQESDVYPPNRVEK